ncbi:helix-turn-helix transcriptional regulator [Flavobacterium psychrophilum]|nr:helix-turn-helix transcriptional regulator [Flavobacterium psychrophilum]
MEKFNFKKFRLSKSKTQTEFAEILGVSRSIIAKIENENIEISKKIFEKLIKYFSNDYKEIIDGYNNAHLITQGSTQPTDGKGSFFDTTIGFNRKDSLDNNDVDYTYYYLQNMEYERMQKWLLNIVKLLTTEFKRKINETEKNELYTCTTNTYSTSYIKQNGETKFKKFIDEHINLTKELIDKYLDEYYKLKLEANSNIDNLDFL